MARPRQVVKDGAKWCAFHGAVHPVADFGRRVNRDGTITINSSCRVAEQTARDAKKAADPASASIDGRAGDAASRFSKALGSTITKDWVLVELNWLAFVPLLRALISPGGRCLNCAKHWDDPRQYHLDHRFPVGSLTDWPLQHSRNLWLICPGCNTTKGARDGDRAWIEAEHHKWMAERRWADHAGEYGWPPVNTYFGQPTELIVPDTAYHDDLGTGTLFDPDPFVRLGPRCA